MQYQIWEESGDKKVKVLWYLSVHTLKCCMTGKNKRDQWAGYPESIYVRLKKKPNMTRYWKQVYQHNGFNTSKFNNKTTAIDNLAIGRTQQDLLLG